MKKILNVMLVLGSASILMVACKKEEIGGSELQSQEAALRGYNPTLPQAKTYKLVRRGNDSIFYYNDGRLAKVKHSDYSYTQYNYGGFGEVTAKTFESNKLAKEMKYLVNVNTGRVYESEYTGYSYYSAGTVVTTRVHKYEYDAQGRLVKKYNKAFPNEKEVFIWGASGISQIKSYDKNNKQLTIVEFSNYWASNKLKMHSPRTGLDIYLTGMFGKASSKIASYEGIYKAGPTSTLLMLEYLYYSYNDDGYPTECWLSDAMDEKFDPKGTVKFGYKISE